MSGEHDSSRYYVPEQSRLPILASVGLFLTVLGAANLLNDMSANVEDSMAHWVLFAGALLMSGVLYTWFSTVIRENRQGLNNAQLKRSYVIGMSWFIFSEVMFFAAFFGALYYVRNLAGPWLGGEGAKGISNYLWPEFAFDWPLVNNPDPDTYPAPKHLIDPWHLPLWNTIILIISSITVHFAHTALKKNNRSMLTIFLGLTVVLGIVFLGLQILEYYEAYTELGLTLESGIYGATFFMLTGFHGAHVTIGTLMLFIMLIRVLKGHFTPDDHFGFEAASWYWHFVDVVWVGLFLFVYVLV